MVNSPLVSVIVPVYNVEKYLREAVESVIHQTYKNLEIFLVDDGSTDNSGAICDDYCTLDDRIKVIHKPNGGLSSARNAAMGIMRGEFVFFLDSDDVASATAIDTYVKLCIAHNADVAMGNLYEFYNDFQACPNAYSEEIICYSKFDALKSMFMNDKLRHCAAGPLFKTFLWKDIRFPEGKLYEDHATVFYVVSQANKVVYYNGTMYYYRVRSNSITRSPVTEKDLELLDINDEVATAMSESYPDLKPYILRMTMEIYLKLYCRIIYVKFDAFEEAQARIRRKVLENCVPFIRSGLAEKNDFIKLAAFIMGKLPFYLVYRTSDWVQYAKNTH